MMEGVAPDLFVARHQHHAQEAFMKAVLDIPVEEVRLLPLVLSLTHLLTPTGGRGHEKY